MKILVRCHTETLKTWTVTLHINVQALLAQLITKFLIKQASWPLFVSAKSQTVTQALLDCNGLVLVLLWMVTLTQQTLLPATNQGTCPSFTG